MLQIDSRNWTVLKAHFWFTGLTLGTLQRVFVFRPKFRCLAEL